MAYDLTAALRIDTGGFVQGMRDASRQMSSMSNNVDAVDNQVSGLSSSLRTMAGALAGYFAVDSIKNLGVSMVEAAADAQALGAQFDQVFGKVEGDARKLVESLGKDFGMVSTRLEPAMAQTTSMFKGLGMDTQKAMTKATEAITLTADAAAFYDKSYEDANAALNSFIKGNYEGGEAIGLFANETQLAAWASKNLSLDWKTLDEAGKQVARLEFAKSMQGAAGATGQASRESNSYSNQLGNLKQTWTDLKAQLATPILEPVINGLKSMAEWLGKIDTAAIIENFSAFGSYMSGIFTPVFNDSKIAIEGIWKAFESVGGVEIAKAALDGLKAGLEWIRDNSSIIVAGLVGLGAAFGTLQAVGMVTTAFNFFKTALTTSTVATTLQTIATKGLNAALKANPLMFVATLIGLVVAAGVSLYQNWDVVKAKAGELWGKTKEVFGNIYEWGVNKIQPVVDFFKGLSDTFGDFKDAITSFELPDWVTSIGSTISGAASKVTGWVDGSHAGGLNYVPFNGYIARLHKGERILTPEENAKLNKLGLNNIATLSMPNSVPLNYEPRSIVTNNYTDKKTYRTNTIDSESDGKSGTGAVSVSFAGAQFTVREEADIDKIANRFLEKLREAREGGA
ncbi:hypothetical protein [Bacillus sp. JJ722]|uniref:hypothetical protein n=1 Tax=Bacillus sp. JJ722 TaxID=3122973 RepID=UPI002FFE7BBC